MPFASDLADGEIKMIHLEEIELSENDIRDPSFSAFALAIERGHLRKLRTMCFVSNQITDEGAFKLAAAIDNNKRTALFDIRLGFQSVNEPHAPRVSTEGGKAAIEAAGATLGRKVHCTLAVMA